MSSRKRREARRERSRAAATPAAPVSQEPISTARPASNRSTFRVAQAQRQLAAELPGIVRNRQAEKLASKPRRAPLEGLATFHQGEAKSRPSGVVKTTRAPQAKLERGDLDLKCRPKSDKPSSGGGSGRSFVPWGNC